MPARFSKQSLERTLTNPCSVDIKVSWWRALAGLAVSEYVASSHLHLMAVPVFESAVVVAHHYALNLQQSPLEVTLFSPLTSKENNLPHLKCAEFSTVGLYVYLDFPFVASSGHEISLVVHSLHGDINPYLRV